MEFEGIKKSWAGIRFWVIAASLVIVVAGMKAMSNLILMILMAVFITAISLAPFQWLNKRKVPEVIALILVILTIMGVLYGFTVLLGASVNGFSERLPFYQQRFDHLWLNAHHWLVSTGLVDKDANLINIIKSFNIMKSSGSAVASAGKLVSDPLITMFIYIFMMLEVTIFGKK